MPDFSGFFLSVFIDDEGDLLAFAPLLLFLAGFIYYMAIYRRYRNTDKRHHHENETTTTVQNLQQYDQLIEHRKGLRNSTMKGSNDNAIEGSLSQNGNALSLGDLGNLGNAVGKLIK